MSLPLQPFLHDLVTTFAAPTQVLSDRAGDIVSSESGPAATGVIHADVRVVSDLRLRVDGQVPEHIATTVGAGETTFTSVLRRLAAGPLDLPDPQVRLDRHRQVSPGVLTEELVFSSVLAEPVDVSVAISLRSDFAAIEAIKVGSGSTALVLDTTERAGEISWRSGDVGLTLTAPGAELALADEQTVTVVWAVTVPAHGATAVAATLRIEDTGSVVVAASTPPMAVAEVVARWAAAQPDAAGDRQLQTWLRQSLSDLNSLRMATAADPGDTFFAAGSPWYLTLFGRDSLWTSRLLLPFDVGQAAGTLQTLARLAGTRTDPTNAESPGKIMHELRRGQFSFAETSLPPLYYGTIDATPLWICLLHDAWRAGLDEEVVHELLPTLLAALEWIQHFGDADGDGFLEYVDASGRGLVNQGWKDSGDSIRFADGTIAQGPVALCEVQGYAYEAARSGAAVLDAFGLEGGDGYRAWAADLADRFRAQFWCGEGSDRYPALALDGDKRRVDSVTSNIGHLLGTGILYPEEELLVAQRVTAPDMDSGLGLRTMSSVAGGYSPLSYHCGSVWPHDTAIVILGLHKAGLGDHATGLVDGLMRASVAFDARFPELWSGEGRPVPYPAACRPQAWSAAAAVTVAAALTASCRLSINS